MSLLLIVGTIIFFVAQFVLTRKGKTYSSLVLAIFYSLLTILYFQYYMLFIAIILWIIFIVGMIKRKNIEEKNKVNKTAIFLVVFTTVIVIGFGYYYLNGMVTEGVFTIEEQNMLEENGQHYLFLEEQKIEVSEELFNLVEINSQYHIKYSWNKLSQNNGKIVSFNKNY